VAAWLGVQEALHDRVLTLDEALPNWKRSRPAQVQSLASG
jgi:hypothetical protein